MATNHIASAVEYLDAVEATREHLSELYKTQRNFGHNDKLGANIAEAHQKIGHGLKAASINAEIAQASALERIAGALADLLPGGKAVSR